MDVKVVESGPCRKSLEVHAAADELKSDYEAVLDAYCNRGKIPGFRPGKAPRNVVAKRFSKQIDEDTKDAAVPRLYHEALKEKSIQPVAVINVEDLVYDKAAGLQFKVLVDVPPEFKLPKYKRIPVKAETAEVTDPQVDEAIKGIRERFANYNDVEDRALRSGDLAMVDFEATIDGGALKEIAPNDPALGSSTDFYVMLGDSEFLPGFNAGLEGVGTGETTVIPVTFPGDYRVSDVAGKAAEYRVTVKSIKERILPEMNAEFFKLLDVDSEDALRTRIRTQMAQEAEAREQDRRKGEIAKFLVEKTKLDIPQSVLDQERQMALRNMVQQFTRSGGTKEQIEANRDQILNAATESSTERIKVSYILSRIASEESIDATEDEVNDRVSRMAGQYQMTPEEFRSELDERNGWEGLRSDIRNEKALDFLLTEAKIK